MLSQESIIRSSGEDAIELIKEHRDDLIKRLSNTTFLKNYLLEEFHLSDPSQVKLEFIKRALLELRSSRIDLSHYAALILETRRSGSFSISKQSQLFFRRDIERSIKNYL